MRKKKILISALSLFLFPCLSVAASACKTHILCDVSNHGPEDCMCTIAANSAYESDFYFDMKKLKKGRKYECQFGSSPIMAHGTLEGSTFPPGVTYEYRGPYPRFPVILEVNTMNMQASEGTMIFKFFIPRSIYSIFVRGYCMLLA